MRTTWRWFARHPLLSWVLATTIVVAPGYWWQAQSVDETHRVAVDAAAAAVQAQKAATQAQATADALTELVLQLERERAERRHELCERDVADRADDRAMWDATLDVFEGEPVVAELRVLLEELLPPLVCGPDHVPVPT